MIHLAFNPTESYTLQEGEEFVDSFMSTTAPYHLSSGLISNVDGGSIKLNPHTTLTNLMDREEVETESGDIENFRGMFTQPCHLV